MRPILDPRLLHTKQMLKNKYKITSIYTADSFKLHHIHDHILKEKLYVHQRVYVDYIIYNNANLCTVLF